MYNASHFNPEFVRNIRQALKSAIGKAATKGGKGHAWVFNRRGAAAMVVEYAPCRPDQHIRFMTPDGADCTNQVHSALHGRIEV